MAVASVGDQLLGELRHGRIQVVADHVDDGGTVAGGRRNVINGVSPENQCCLITQVVNDGINSYIELVQLLEQY